MESQDTETRPESFERQLSPEEQRAVLVNFMGNVYGESKKLDSNIINGSNTLRNRSNDVKNHIERLVSTPVTSSNNLPSTSPASLESVPVPSPSVSQPVVTSQPVAATHVDDPNQLTFDFNVNEKEELFTLVEKLLTRQDKLHRKVDAITDSINTLQQLVKVDWFEPKKKSET